jgi:hypothetical protein
VTAAEKITQYLTDARNMEATLRRLLQAHMAVTPEGDYRELVRRHLGETERRIDRIDRRLDDTEKRAARRSPGQAATGALHSVVGQALGLSKGPLDLVRGGSPEEKLLRNAKVVFAAESLGGVTYDALEAVSRRGGDVETATLAVELREAAEQLANELRGFVPALAEGAVGADCAQGDSWGDPSLEHA